MQRAPPFLGIFGHKQNKGLLLLFLKNNLKEKTFTYRTKFGLGNFKHQLNRRYFQSVFMNIL